MKLKLYKKTPLRPVLRRRTEGVRRPHFSSEGIDQLSIKKKENQSDYYLSLLEAALEATADGILVVNLNGALTLYNKRFVQIWNIPQSILKLKDNQKALDYVKNLLFFPDAFMRKVKDLY